MKRIAPEELIKNLVNDNLCRTKVREVKDFCSYDLYGLELDNNNILQSELQAISEVVGDDDLQVEIRGGYLYVLATIDSDTINEMLDNYYEE